MIKRPTVLILGAGASVDHGLPTGRRLLLDIYERTADGDNLFGIGGRNFLLCLLTVCGVAGRVAKSAGGA
jgi:hypothetical protein